MRRLPALLFAVTATISACGSTSSTKTTATSSPSGPTTSTLVPGEPTGTKTYRGLGRHHVDTAVQYPQTPPVGGDHWPVWQTCRFYAATIQPERGVHSLEHGAVWITYSRDLPADQIAALEALEPSHNYLLISPFAGLPSKVVATAWGKQLLLDSPSDPRLAQFIAYYEAGPQAPETNVPCQDGSTATI